MRKRREIDSIYDSALKYFARYGYKKATLDNIALDLNMTNANLYSYAKNKRQLYCDCVYYAVDEFLSRLKDLLSCIEDPYEKLDFIWDNTLGVILENKNFCEILVADNLSQYATHSDDPWISVNTTFVDFAT
ncbi:MAG: TetR/AcrR family transcriptional regulator, partial [Clostridia bacterium]